MKLCLLGGGGFRTPLTWASLAPLVGEGDVEVVLHDIASERLTRMAAVIEGLRQERGGGPPVSTTTSLDEALEGADFVFCAIRVGGLVGRVIDETVPLREGVLGQETVGPGGICFALRTVPVMRLIAERVGQRAPAAWFLNFTNPAGLVTEALRPVLGERVIGICDSPAALCARVAGALRRPMSALRFDYAGLNHLGWLLAVWDAGRDLLPELLGDDACVARLEAACLFGTRRLRAQGVVPNEYLVYLEAPGAIVEAFRRAGATRGQLLLEQQERFYRGSHDSPAEALASWRQARDARFGTYMAEAWDAVARGSMEDRGEEREHGTDEGPGEAGYGAVAAGFVGAVTGDGEETLVLDVANRGRLPFLDDDAVVEVPCSVSSSGVRAQQVGELSRPQAELVARIKEVERTTIRAALEGSRRLAVEALVAHPVVPTRAAAERILQGYLRSLPGLAARLA